MSLYHSLHGARVSRTKWLWPVERSVGLSGAHSSPRTWPDLAGSRSESRRASVSVQVRAKIQTAKTKTQNRVMSGRGCACGKEWVEYFWANWGRQAARSARL